MISSGPAKGMNSILWNLFFVKLCFNNLFVFYLIICLVNLQ